MVEKIGNQLAFYLSSLRKIEVTRLMWLVAISGKTTEGLVLSTSYLFEIVPLRAEARDRVPLVLFDVCVCVCVRVCVRARVCVRVCVHVCSYFTLQLM